MRTLSSSLLNAQRAESGLPYIKVTARNDPMGVVSLVWERLYSGAETDGRHSLAVAGDGSLIRLRSTPLSDGRKVYYQRAVETGGQLDFSQWSYLDVYNINIVATCARGSEVCLFWIRADGRIDCLKSTDNGVTFGSPEYPGSGSGAVVEGLAAAYRPTGDLYLFFTDTSNLCVSKRLNGVWQDDEVWNKSTGALSGIAVIYDNDWQILLSGRDNQGAYCLWSLLLGDGGALPTGVWGDLNLILKAPPGAGYSFGAVFMDKPDVCRFFCNEIYLGDEPYYRPLWAHALPQTAWVDNLWSEPQPFNHQNLGGLALAHDEQWAWLSCPAGVWRAPLASRWLDLSQDLLNLRLQVEADSARLTAELSNSHGQWGAGSLPDLLQPGSRLDVAPGYHTGAGEEYSPGLSFRIESLQWNSQGGRSSLIIEAADAWEALRRRRARYSQRWNDGYNEASLKALLARLLARAGIRLVVISLSAQIEDFFPDFLIQAGENAAAAIHKLLSLTPDRLFIEGHQAFLVNPLPDDSTVYSFYGASAGTVSGRHIIQKGVYRQSAADFNRIIAAGWNAGAVVSAEAFHWPQLEKAGERTGFIQDINLKSAAAARGQAEIRLRRAGMEAIDDYIRAAPHCGLQLLDVIEITDPAAGLTGLRRRVSGYDLRWQPESAGYVQQIKLGEV